MLTEGVDYADASKSTHDDVADTFKFTDASEKITATFAQLSKGDQLIDLSNADNDTLDLILDINNVKQTIGSKNGATLVNIEELDITSRGAKNITFDNTISAAGLKTIKIAGSFLNEKGNDGNGFTFNGNVLKTLTTIDASAITAGNVNIDASKATQDLTITGPNFAASINGGSGDDTITGQGTINAGSGDDIITITGKSNVTGGEGKDTFDVQAGKVTITDLGSGKDIIKVAAGAEVTANVGSGWTATADSTNDGTLTFKLGSGANVNLVELVGHENVNLDVASGTGSATVTGFTATELTKVGSGAQLNIIGFGVDEEGVTIDMSKADVDGSGKVSIKGTAGDDIITTAATGSTTVDAGAGNDTINTYADATINGGAGDDTIYVKVGGSINGGAGNDTIDASTATDAVTIEGGAGKDTISLGAGADVVKFTAATTGNENNITNFGTTDKLSFLKTAFGNISWQTSSGFTETFSSNNIETHKVYFGTAITDDALDGLATSGDVKALAITQTGKIYYLVDDNSTGVTPTLVGSVNIDTLKAGNIEFV